MLRNFAPALPTKRRNWPQMKRVKPKDYLYIRKNGQGVLSFSVPPDRQQLLAEAIAVLMVAYHGDDKAERLATTIVERARYELYRDADLRRYIKRHLRELTPFDVDEVEHLRDDLPSLNYPNNGDEYP